MNSNRTSTQPMKNRKIRVGDRVTYSKEGTWLGGFLGESGEVLEVTPNKAYVLLDMFKEKNFAYFFWLDELTLESEYKKRNQDETDWTATNAQ